MFSFDCTDRESFTALEEWIEKTEGFLDVKGLVSVLAATKTDLERTVTEEEAKNFARLKKLVTIMSHSYRPISIRVQRQATASRESSCT